MAALATLLEEYTITNATAENRAGRAVFVDSVQALMGSPDEDDPDAQDEESELPAVDSSMTMPMAGLAIRPMGVVGHSREE